MNLNNRYNLMKAIKSTMPTMRTYSVLHQYKVLHRLMAGFQVVSAVLTLDIAQALLQAPSMSLDGSKDIVFVRHGCTYMNEYLSKHPWGSSGFTDVFPEEELAEYYLDSPLSPLGLDQVRGLLQKKPSSINDWDLVVVSPLTRALQTFEGGLRPHLSKRVPVIALPDASERLYLISDRGKPVEVLKHEFPFVNFEYLCGEGGRQSSMEWWYTPEKGSDFVEWRPIGDGQKYACLGEPDKEFDERMNRLLHWLERRSEKCIAVVCHWGVIDWMLGQDFDNCEVKRVAFTTLKEQRS